MSFSFDFFPHLAHLFRFIFPHFIFSLLFFFYLMPLFFIFSPSHLLLVLPLSHPFLISLSPSPSWSFIPFLASTFSCSFSFSSYPSYSLLSAAVLLILFLQFQILFGFFLFTSFLPVLALPSITFSSYFISSLHFFVTFPSPPLPFSISSFSSFPYFS